MLTFSQLKVTGLWVVLGDKGQIMGMAYPTLEVAIERAILYKWFGE